MRNHRWIAVLLCLVFAVFYSILSIIRHLHFGSYGFDLGITDQIVWLYSRLHVPITTVQAYPFTSILTDHVELIYVLFAPFYWVFQSPITILVLQALALSFSGLPIYLLAEKKKLPPMVGVSLVISYLMFYGVQNAVWFDVHSVSFGAAALAWFIYFLDSTNVWGTLITVVLAIICKEDVALFTGLVALVYFIRRRDRVSLLSGVISLAYVATIFGIYFPFFTKDGYRYRSDHIALSVSALFDGADKQKVWIYSFASFGFLPLLSPFLLLPMIGDILHYFVLAPDLTAAQGLFMHYRVTLAPLMMLPTIEALKKWKRLQPIPIAVYLVCCALIVQYVLHLPLSYLTKSWFWTTPNSVADINRILSDLPSNASVVAQNNITPHISHRAEIFTLYPTTKEFTGDSPCGEKSCDWFRWAGNPKYLIVDTSTDWDERSFLVPREKFIQGLTNMGTAGSIIVFRRSHEAIVYEIVSHP